MSWRTANVRIQEIVLEFSSATHAHKLRNLCKVNVQYTATTPIQGISCAHVMDNYSWIVVVLAPDIDDIYTRSVCLFGGGKGEVNYMLYSLL